MPTFKQTVYVDVDFDDLDEQDLIDELESRGFTVTKDPVFETDFVNVAWHVERGELKEALILLERQVLELRGISQLVN